MPLRVLSPRGASQQPGRERTGYEKEPKPGGSEAESEAGHLKRTTLEAPNSHDKLAKRHYRSDSSLLFPYAANMKPTRVQPYLLLFVVAALVALVGWWGANRLRSTLRETLGAELETTLRANADALQIWMTNQMRLAIIVATEPQLGSLAMAGQATSLRESRPEGLEGATPQSASNGI